jgi:hypothetical protein
MTCGLETSGLMLARCSVHASGHNRDNICAVGSGTYQVWVVPPAGHVGSGLMHRCCVMSWLWVSNQYASCCVIRVTESMALAAVLERYVVDFILCV